MICTNNTIPLIFKGPHLAQNKVRADFFSGPLTVIQFEMVASADGRQNLNYYFTFKKFSTEKSLEKGIVNLSSTGVIPIIIIPLVKFLDS